MNLHDRLTQQIEIKPDDVALVYFGISISYGRLGKMIENVTSGLRNLGINHGDIVSVALPTTPESIALVYALNKLGAIVCLIDVRFKAKQVTSIVNRTRSKILFIMNINVIDTAKAVSEMNVDHIVVMRGCEAFPKQIAFWYGLGEWLNGRKLAFLSNKRFKHWDDIIHLSTKDKIDCYEWQANEPQMIFQTSGTTGISKSVLLTAENIERTQSAISNYNVSSGDTSLDLLPIFAYSGFNASIHWPLSYGLRVVIIPIWKPRNFIKIISKYKPQHVFTVPSMWDTIYKPENQSYSFGFIKTIIIAGDVMKPAYERDINDYLHSHGCNINISKMYGMTETAGAVAVTAPNSPNQYKLGYSGYIIADHQIKVMDDEICICPSTIFHGYFDNQQATDQLIRNHNGKTWIHTGDVGYLNDTGELFVIGRKKRMIVRHDGTKVFPIEIEMALLECQYVKACTIVDIDDTSHPQSKVPVAYVVLKQNNLSNKTKVNQYVKKHLPLYLQPYKIIFIKELPYNQMGKIDYSKL